jgi:hypothetical protein
MAVLLAWPVLSFAQALVSVEYQLKAVFLFNFTRFVEWPPEAFTSDQEPFVIGVLGGNPFGSYLEDVGGNEKVNGHRLVIRYFNNYSEIKSCHILYINKTVMNETRDFLSSMNGKPVLTVSDASDFMKRGGIIRFYINKDKKVQLEMNLDAAKAAKLQISSKLIRLTEIYVPK